VWCGDLCVVCVSVYGVGSVWGVFLCVVGGLCVVCVSVCDVGVCVWCRDLCMVCVSVCGVCPCVMYVSVCDVGVCRVMVCVFVVWGSVVVGFVYNVGSVSGVCLYVMCVCV